MGGLVVVQRGGEDVRLAGREAVFLREPGQPAHAPGAGRGLRPAGGELPVRKEKHQHRHRRRKGHGHHHRVPRRVVKPDEGHRRRRDGEGAQDAPHARPELRVRRPRREVQEGYGEIDDARGGEYVEQHGVYRIGLRAVEKGEHQRGACEHAGRDEGEIGPLPEVREEAEQHHGPGIGQAHDAREVDAALRVQEDGDGVVQGDYDRHEADRRPGDGQLAPGRDAALAVGQGIVQHPVAGRETDDEEDGGHADGD